jgi:membrane fusion protein (multidrug efflux system)
MQEKSSKPAKGQAAPRVNGTPTPKEATSPKEKVPLYKNRLLVGSLAALIVLAIAGYFYWRHYTLYPSTDNAYVQASAIKITPLVTGVVTEVNVTEFAHVKSGDVLLKIDPAPFEAALKAAEARLDVVEEQAGPADKRPAAAKASVAEAQAAVDKARFQIDHATIKAPIDGIVGDVRISTGDVAKAGMSVFPLIDTSKWWVDANFKETDLTRIAKGQKATVHIDLYPSHEFSGEVEAISPASVSSFSLLPSENATGSWVKVTQRFPVRVSLDLKPDDPAMRLGASASVVIDTTSEGSTSGAK